MTAEQRTLEFTAELLQAYSRRGNFHSDPEIARGFGMKALVAQGMHAAGPAYGLLLDAWGEEFLAHGEIELKFVGMVVEGDTAEATVTVDGPAATLEVRNAGATAVVGRASRTGPAG